MVPFSNTSPFLEIAFIAVCIILIAFFISTLSNWKEHMQRSKFSVNSYSYIEPNGPSFWKTIYESSRGCLQSPINICLNEIEAVPVDPELPLCFSEEYNHTPRDMSLCNNGHSVTIYATWDRDVRPVVTGGPCLDKFQFLHARFRWGPNDHEGSEHTINHKCYAMELQAIHTKAGRCYKNLSCAAADNALLIISYLYEISPVENPYIKVLLSKFRKIQNPLGHANVEPVPLFFLMPSFVCNYINYIGSLTHPPCTEGVQWIIQPEPLGIASNQVAQFRRLQSFCDSLDMNRRPVQELNDRYVVFYE